jgi:hypothetical protein
MTRIQAYVISKKANIQKITQKQSRDKASKQCCDVEGLWKRLKNSLFQRLPKLIELKVILSGKRPLERILAHKRKSCMLFYLS